METKRTRHATYDIAYHLVWCPKFRRPVLVDVVAKRLEELIREQTETLGGKVIALEICLDHVHLFANFPPTLAVRQIVHRIKGYTSHGLRKDFDWLNSRLPSLWTRSYYVGTAGNVSAEAIRKYIEAQTGR